MGKKIILGVNITNRTKNVLEIQKILTAYGCNIKTRLGLHEVNPEACSPSGLLLLEMIGDKKAILEMADKLSKVTGVQVKKMVFDN
jgi:hypothetical protein